MELPSPSTSSQRTVFEPAANRQHHIIAEPNGRYCSCGIRHRRPRGEGFGSSYGATPNSSHANATGHPSDRVADTQPVTDADPYDSSHADADRESDGISVTA